MRTSEAVAYYGTKAELARALGIARQAITSWGAFVPPRRALELEKLTRGKLKAPPLQPRAA